MSIEDTLDDLNRHQASKRADLTLEKERVERRKQGPDNVNLPSYISDNVTYHIDQILERKRNLLVELRELNVLLVKLHTLSDVTGP